MSAFAVTTGNGAVRFKVHVQPRASKTGIAGIHGTALKVRLHAPPVDGAANEALIEFLAKRLRISKRSVRIVAGETSREKLLEVDGISVASVQALEKGAVE